MNELDAIIERDRISAATWFAAPNTGPARAFQDRRFLLGEIAKLQQQLAEHGVTKS